MDLMYLIAVLGILFGCVTFLMVRYWSSLVSNRFLLSGVMKIYVLCCLIKWIFTIATLIVVFQTFGEVPRWGVGVDRDTNTMLPLYVWTVLFMFPYMLLLCYFGMDFSYLNEEIEFGGTITEPGAVGYIDLSGMSMQECCTKLFAFPLA